MTASAAPVTALDHQAILAKSGKTDLKCLHGSTVWKALKQCRMPQHHLAICSQRQFLVLQGVNTQQLSASLCVPDLLTQ